MPRPTFLDIHPTFNGSSGFCCSNEEPALWRWLLEKRHFRNAGAIASGGDVVLMSLLPKSERLTAIDHNYTSLAFAGTKAVMLDRLGARGFLAAILEGTEPSIKRVFVNHTTELPDFLRNRISTAVWGSGNITELRRVWSAARLGEVEAVRRKLDAMTLIHGDLQDLKTRGQLDCLYVSNAVDSGHIDRDGKTPTMEQMGPLVGRDGVMLMARHVGVFPKVDTDHWTHRRRLDPCDNLGGCRWSYDLHVRKPWDGIEVRESLAIGTQMIYTKQNHTTYVR